MEKQTLQNMTILELVELRDKLNTGKTGDFDLYEAVTEELTSRTGLHKGSGGKE